MKQRKWAVGLVTLWVAIAIISTGKQTVSRAQEVSVTKPDLTGVVKDSDGQPLPQASVFIYTAGPKIGTGILCPSCYADCRKRATTDAEGRFKIESLDPNLLFRILVVA